MRLHSRSSGPRDADRGLVLFVHGFPFDGSMWEHQLSALPAGWRGVAPDLRGFGRSELRAAADGLPTGSDAGQGVALDHEPVLLMDRHADDLADLLRAESGGPAVVCGLSMGGYVAFALRRRHPDLVRALVLSDTRPGGDSEDGVEGRRRTAATARTRGADPIARDMVASLLSESSRQDPAVVDHVRRMIRGTTPETLVAALAGMAARPDATAELPGLARPALVAVGEEDGLTPPATARAMADAIPGARLETVPSAGHLAPLENPAAFNDALHRFLAGL